MTAQCLPFIVLFSSVLCFVSTRPLELQKNLHGNFTFKNCNTSAVPLYITSLEIRPDPIQLEKELRIKASLSLDRNIGEQNRKIEVESNIRLKTVEGYTELCEIIGKDDCRSNDLCDELNNLMGKEKSRYKYPCPFTKQNYNISTLPLFLKPVPFQLSGVFDIIVNIKEEGTDIGCLNFQFCVTKCKPLGQNETRFFKDYLRSIIKRKKEQLSD